MNVFGLFINSVLIMNRENGRWEVITDRVQLNGPNIDVGSNMMLVT